MEKESLKFLEWNINLRASNKEMPMFVIDEIKEKNPDVAILVEFKGEKNAELIKNHLLDYNIYYYNGSLYESKGKIKSGNGVLIALKTKVFKEENIIKISHPDEKKKQPENEPDWLRIEVKLGSKSIVILGVRVKTGDRNEKEDLRNRKDQIEWIFGQNEHVKNIVILGDFNYGPHRTDYCSSLKLNWQDIIDVIRQHDYLKNTIYSPYSPVGYSWYDKKLDWLITKGVTIKTGSTYNKLDWSFGKFNKQYFCSGYLVPEGYFIRSASPFPDHAVFTAEIKL